MSEVATLHTTRINQLIAEWLHLSFLHLHHAPACQREREKRERKEGERGCHYLALDVESVTKRRPDLHLRTEMT